MKGTQGKGGVVEKKETERGDNTAAFSKKGKLII